MEGLSFFALLVLVMVVVACESQGIYRVCFFVWVVGAVTLGVLVAVIAGCSRSMTIGNSVYFFGSSYDILDIFGTG